MPAEKKTLNIISVLNDYVAVIPHPKSDVVDAEADYKYKNEGTVAGIGPDVPSSWLQVGDEVVFRQNKYLMVKPDSGKYEGMDILFIHKPDLVLVNHKSDPKYIFVDGDAEIGD